MKLSDEIEISKAIEIIYYILLILCVVFGSWAIYSVPC